MSVALKADGASGKTLRQKHDPGQKQTSRSDQFMSGLRSAADLIGTCLKVPIGLEGAHALLGEHLRRN